MSDENETPKGEGGKTEELVVKRGPLQDSAEWASPDAAPPSSPFRVEPGVAHGETPPEQSAAPRPEPQGPFGSGARPWALIGIVVTMLALGGLAIAFMPKPPEPFRKPLVATSADLAPVHAGVSAGGEPVRVLRRVGVKSPVETDENGRARLRLDTGTTIIVDRSTKLTVTERGIDLASGRVFVVAADGAKVSMGDAVVSLSGSTAAFEKRGDAEKVYAANGDLSVRDGGADTPVHVGESASIAGAKVTVTPERGFDDWTGGMAAPWSAEGPPRRAMGEIWGRSQPGDPGSPLTIRAVNVDAKITGEVARTEVQTTFFNAGQANVVGDFRMAIPKGAIVARFATQRGNRVTEGRPGLAARGSYVAPDFNALRTRGDILEWAGDGWLRGTIPDIAAGATVTVVVSYVTWLSPSPKSASSSVVEYRYPMVGEGAPPLIGEFFARVDAGSSEPIAIAAGMDAHISGAKVEVRKSDFKPTADWVVDVELPTGKAPARAYVAEPPNDDDAATLIVRTEAPSAVATGSGGQGVTLALVLDSSTSVDPALLDAGKAFVEAVVRGLGPDDRVVVLAADQGVRPVGPPDLGKADEARKKAIIEALGSVEQGGATDLGRSFEEAAAKLPDDAPDGMVVYVGDGWPTLGDLTPEAIRARLARRERGAPRLGAVAVGPSANRWILAALTKDSGPLIEVADSEAAAKASVELLENALVPTVTSVSLDLGPSVERVYPRSDLAVRLGSTITYVGTLRGKPPQKVALTYRDAKGLHREVRDVALQAATYGDDARRRWAELRVESIALSGGGREATTDAALRAGLITPWTALLTNGGEYLPTSLGARVLDAAVGPDLGFNAVLATPRVFGGALAAPRDAASFEDADYPIQGAMDLAARRVVDDAKSALRSCRDSRAALRPELSGSVELTFKLSGEGRASDIRAQGMSDNDDPLNRCLENVIEGLTFPRSLTNDTVTVTYVASFPPPDPTLRARKCSPTSTLDLPLRRGVWRERIDRMTAPAAYLDAKRSCELPNWTAKRSMLELILSTLGGSGRPALEHAKALEDAGDAEAAAFLRKEAIRRAAPEELKALRSMLLATERVPRTELDKQYAAAIDDKARLGVVRRFLGFAPHSTLLQRREIELLAALGDKENLVAAVRRIRLDPFADATLIAAGAHLLRKAGPELEAEARRTFFEIAERGPSDPWGRAFLGDRLRAEGWFDDATESYEVLDRLVPSDGATGIRLALAHAGAKRLDVALRVLSRIEKTGGRGADKLASLVADRLAHLLIQEALEAKELAPETRSSLTAREADFPALSSSRTIVIRTDGGSSPLTVVVERGPEKAREVIEPDAILASLGVYTVALPAGDTSNVTLTLSQPKGVRPEAPVTARVGVLRAGGGVVGGSFDMKLSGDGTRVGWDGHALAVLGDKAAK